VTMKYATLGRTGLKVSRLGFGAMRLPMDGESIDRKLAIPMIHKAFEAGVTYIDTAVGYCNQDSQRVVGEALKGWRDKVVLSTKNHYFGTDEKEWWQHLENSLERLQTDHIDIYNTHGVNGGEKLTNVTDHVIKWLRSAKDQGMIKHICTSFHDGNDALRKVIDSDFYDSVTIQYNLLDRQLEDGIAYAREKNVGVIVMGPVAGGRLGAPNKVLSEFVPGIERIPELALRFVLANPNVDIALSGMSTMTQVEENIAISSDDRDFGPDELAAIDEQLARLKKTADIYCTGCAYCRPCPQGVNIPRVFDTYNQARAYGLWDNAKNAYKRWAGKQDEKQMQADACNECAECEEKCPQDIPIRKQLKEAHSALTG
jgi:predicted aldo/keto reductase-like oxidoreductase